jgi:hypothetical protein
MNQLESRLEKLEAKAPAQQLPWVQQIFDPEDFGGNIADMDNAITSASREAEDRGERLIARVLVPAIDGRPKIPRTGETDTPADEETLMTTYNLDSRLEKLEARCPVRNQLVMILAHGEAGYAAKYAEAEVRPKSKARNYSSFSLWHIEGRTAVLWRESSLFTTK